MVGDQQKQQPHEHPRSSIIDFNLHPTPSCGCTSHSLVRTSSHFGIIPRIPARSAAFILFFFHLLLLLCAPLTSGEQFPSTRPTSPSPHYLSHDNFNSCLLSPNGSAEWTRTFAYKNKNYDLRIEVTNRASHRIISHILAILLKEELHYKTVTFMNADWDSPHHAVTRLTCASSNCAEPPQAFINLEVWMPPGFDFESWVNRGNVIDCGPLGPITKLGLFTYSALVNQLIGSTGIGLDHYRTLQEASLRRQVLRKVSKHNWRNVEEHQQLWQTDSSNCPNSSETDYEQNCFSIYTDRPEFLAPLHNVLQEVFSQSHYNIHMGNRSTLMHRLLSNKSHLDVLDYFVNWYPNVLTVLGNYSRLLLPDTYKAVNDGLAHDGVGNFTVYQPSKVIWSELPHQDKAAFKLVKDLKFTQAEYKSLLSKVTETHPEDIDQTYHNIACQWLKDNRLKWKPWVRGGKEKKNLTIGVLLPRSTSSDDKDQMNIIQEGAKVARKQLNEQFATTQYQVKLEFRYNNNTRDDALLMYINLTKSCKPDSSMIGVIAALDTDSLEPIMKLGNVQRLLIISPNVNMAKYLRTEGPTYKYFFQTIPSMRLFSSVLIDILRQFNYSRVTVFREEYFVDLQALRNSKIEVLDHQVKESDMNFTQAMQSLQLAKENCQNVFLVQYNGMGAKMLLCAAAFLNMSPHNSSNIWFLNPKFHNFLFMSLDEATPECDDFLLDAIKYHFTLKQDLPEASARGFIMGGPSGESMSDPSGESIGDSRRVQYCAYTYDAVFLLGMAAYKLLEKKSSSFSALRSESVAEELQKIVAESKWSRTLGHGTKAELPMQFNEKNEVESDIWVLHQMENDQSFIPVFKWTKTPTNQSNTVRVKTIDKGDWFRTVKNEEIVLSYKNRRVCDQNMSMKPCLFDPLPKLLGWSCPTTTGLIFFFIFSLLVSVMLATIVYYRRKVSHARFPYKQPYLELSKELSYIDILPSNLVINRRIGNGAFAVVFGGEYRTSEGWKNIAAKMIGRNAPYLQKIDFLNEAKLMQELKHPCIVNLCGVCLHIPEGIYLVMEHMKHGDLKTFLLSRRTNLSAYEVSPQILTHFMVNVAEGLQFLHSHNIVHRDVAARNCLVNEENNQYFVKLGDFGLARRLQVNKQDRYYQFKRASQLPIRWMSPQDMNIGRFSVQSDIWSFGVLLFEVITFGAFPYEEFSDEIVNDKVKRCELSIVHCLPKEAFGTPIYNVIAACCQYNTEDRPHSMEAVNSLLQSPDNIVQPFLFVNPPKQTFTNMVDLNRKYAEQKGKRNQNPSNFNFCKSQILSQQPSLSESICTSQTWFPSEFDPFKLPTGHLDFGSTEFLKGYMNNDLNYQPDGSENPNSAEDESERSSTCYSKRSSIIGSIKQALYRKSKTQKKKPSLRHELAHANRRQRQTGHLPIGHFGSVDANMHDHILPAPLLDDMKCQSVCSLRASVMGQL